MKKIITILTCLCLILTLGACSTSREEEVVTVEKTVKTVEDMKIVAPSGAPSVAFYNFSDSASFETNGTPSNIVAMMSATEGPDVVVIDTVSGVNAINNGAPYLLAATITFGNFYIAATGNDEDGVMSADDNIILFGQNQTPDLVWHYIYGSEFDEAVSFVAAAGDAAAVLQTGNDAQGNPADYVFLAEPALFASLNKNEKASIYANVQELYLESLNALGINPAQHDIRFVEDDWESPTLGAWGLGWEVWLNGMEVSQFTYFQQVGGIDLHPISVELTYGLERLTMYLQGVESVYDLKWNKNVTYGHIYHQNEVEQSKHNFEASNPEMLLRHFNDFEGQCKAMLEQNLPWPAYDYCLKCSHTFNLLDARGAISITERAGYIGRVRALAAGVAKLYVAQREELGYPMLNTEAR